MGKGNKTANANLRQKAEKLIKKNPAQSGLQFSESNTLKLIHELQVHQIELELQNEELILTKEHAENISAKYTELYDSAPTGYFTLSPEGKILELNPAGAKMLGKDQNNLKNRQFQLYASNTSKPIFNLFLKNVFAGNLKQTCELTLSTNTGSQIYIDLSGIISENGGQCFVTATDVTERKQAEEILRESETKTRTILEAISTGIMIIDPETHTIVDVNSETIRLIGETKEKIIGSICHQYVCPAEKGKCPVTDLKQLVDNSERVLINKENTKIPILKTVTQINLGGRKLLLENFTDISERKHIEEKIHKSEQRYRDLFENAGTAIWEADLSVVINYINQLKESGVYDFRVYFNQHIDEVIKCASMVKLLDANKEILNLVNAKSKKQVLNSLSDFFIEESFGAVREILIGLVVGKLKMEGELPIKTLNGGIKQVLFELSIIQGNENTLAKGLISFTDITDKIEAGKALKQSEKQMHQILENVDAVFYMMSGKTGELVYINSAYEKIWKRPIAEIKENPETWLDAVHPEDVNSVIKLFEQESGELQYRIILPDGTIRWILDRMFPVLDEKGEIVYLCGMASDITERKLYEEKLHESGAKLDEAMKIAKLGMWEYDVDRDQFKFNDQFYTLLHTTAEREGGYIMSSKHYAQKFVHPDDMSLVGSETQKALETTDPNYYNKLDHRIIIADGEIGYISVSIRILKDSDGRTVKTYGVNQDITERKRIEESLRLFRTLIDKSNDAIEVIDMETAQFIDVNERACIDLGYSRSELLSMKVFDIDPNQTLEVFQSFMGSFQHSNSSIIETSHYRKDGSVFPVEVNVTVVKLDKKYTIAIVRDITERKHVEEELINAKNKAEESDRLKSAFLANMSHEIRTPMNGILGFTELLKEPMLSGEKQQEYIKLIQKSGDRMLNIINDIINISRIESDQVKITISDTDIKEQLEYIYNFFKPEAEHKQLHLSFRHSLPGDEFIIKTDKEKIYAVLTNLVKNALKFTQSGSIELGCDKKGEFLEFYVRDTGQGIRKDQQEIIFERFRQGSELLNRSYEGAGLGLAISKAFVKMLGGEIWLESNSDLGSINGDPRKTGSTFFFTIPVNRWQETKIAPEIIETDNATNNQIRKLKILIVEDDEISKILITNIIDIFADNPIKVTTGIEAVNACRNHPDIDLVLMDIKIPGIDGYEATRQIRKFNKDVVIIAQTALGLTGDRENAMEAGCNDYISKPVNRTALRAMINKYFK